MSFFGIFGSNKKYKQQLALQQQQAEAAKAAQQAQWDHEAQLKAQADAAAQAQLEQATAAAQAKHTAALGTATNNARTSAADIVSQWGLDPSAYTGKINSNIDALAGSIGDDADPYSVLDGSQIATKLLTGEQTAKRSALTNEANSKFGVNYGQNLIGDHLLDSTINDLLGTQSTGAQNYLDRGKARGIYNDTGYAAGQAKLGSQANAGRSQLTTLADSVLDGYRAKANTVRDNAYSVAGNATLGQNINLDDYVTQGQGIQAKALDLADDDLTAAVGGQNFFDFGGLTNAAGAAQGTGNFRDSSITGALAERNKQRAAARGLGSQGVF